MSNEQKPKSLHHRIYPYMDHFVQYATDRGPDLDPWVVRDRSTALRNERQGRGKALTRMWSPTDWYEIDVDPFAYKDEDTAIN